MNLFRLRATFEPANALLSLFRRQIGISGFADFLDALDFFAGRIEPIEDIPRLHIELGRKLFDGDAVGSGLLQGFEEAFFQALAAFPDLYGCDSRT